VRQGGRLQAVSKPVYRKTTTIPLQQHQVGLQPLADITPEFKKLGADDFPVFLSAILHMVELGALGQSLIHDVSPVCGACRLTDASLMPMRILLCSRGFKNHIGGPRRR